MAIELITEVLQTGDEIRRNVLDHVGPLAGIVTGVSQLILAGIAIIAIFAGRSFWAPPDHGLKNFAVRISGVVAGVGIVALYLWSKNGGIVSDFMEVAMYGVGMGVIGAFIYLALWLGLTIKCEHDPGRYVKGFRIKKYAQKVLDHDLTGLPQQYGKIKEPLPTSVKEYFCRADKTPEFIWEDWSILCSQLFLFLGYFIFIVPIAIGLSGAAIALSQPEMHIDSNKITFPDDVLFAFDKADIRPGASVSLEQAARIIKSNAPQTLRIEGHTDGLGSIQHNLELSRHRSEAVRSWLINEGRINTVEFSIVPKGSSEPIFSETRADGTDDPEARARNRRVVIILGK